MKALGALMLLSLALLASCFTMTSNESYSHFYTPCKTLSDCKSSESCVRGTCRTRLPSSSWCKCPNGNYCFFGICLNVNRNHWTCIHPLECPDNRKCIEGVCRGM